jgi:hypothetical protein
MKSIYVRRLKKPALKLFFKGSVNGRISNLRVSIASPQPSPKERIIGSKFEMHPCESFYIYKEQE